MMRDSEAMTADKEGMMQPLRCDHWERCHSFARYDVFYRVTGRTDHEREYVCSDCHFNLMQAHDRYELKVLAQHVVEGGE